MHTKTYGLLQKNLNKLRNLTPPFTKPSFSFNLKQKFSFSTSKFNNKKLFTALKPFRSSLFSHNKPFTSTMESDICSSRDRGFLFKQSLHKHEPKFGLVLNSASSTLAEQISFSGYDWVLIDMQHAPMDYITLSSMLNAVNNGKSLAMVRVAGPQDRQGIQKALDLGAHGILIPYVNNAKEAREAVNCCFYPTMGTRSLYLPQQAKNREGLVGFVGHANKNVVVAIQVETQAGLENIDEIVGIKGLDVAFLGQNDLCMSMGLYEEYGYPQMYTSQEITDANDKMLAACKKHKVIPGLFLFGTDRVGEYLKKGFTMISLGNDLHHVLTQADKHLDKVSEIRKTVGK